MVIFDISIGNVALPSIRSDLGFAEQDLQYVVSLYALTYGDFLLRVARGMVTGATRGSSGGRPLVEAD